MKGPYLSKERIAYYRTKLTSAATPCRFLKDGCAVNIVTGDMCSRGSNVIYHPVYWNFNRETAKEIAAELGLKAVFSE